MWLMGLWSARAGAARPRCPQAALARWRRARPGARAASEGGRSPPPRSTGRAGPLAPGQRWSAARKREVVLRLMRGEAAELLSRELGLPLFKLEQWRQKAEAGVEGGLEERGADPADGHTRPAN